MATNKTDKANNPNNAQPDIRFEEAYEELMAIVDQLEAGDLTLDESMTLFERGRLLVTLCEKQLNAAELRVSQLLRDGDGGFRTELLS